MVTLAQVLFCDVDRSGGTIHEMLLFAVTLKDVSCIFTRSAVSARISIRKPTLKISTGDERGLRAEFMHQSPRLTELHLQHT